MANTINEQLTVDDRLVLWRLVYFRLEMLNDLPTDCAALVESESRQVRDLYKKLTGVEYLSYPGGPE